MNLPVLIVGGGLAGLACAHRLHEERLPVLVLESSDAVGGRVRSDEERGFLLDRGFQVYLSAYPEAGRLLDLQSLKLRRFESGALVFKDGSFRRMMDVFRSPRHALSTAMQPIGTIMDKLRVGLLRMRLAGTAIKSIASDEDRTTEDYLQRRGFSSSMIDGFFRPFYGGIFLERDLRTSSRMFEFTFKMFATGHATLPAKGMQEIPRQLAGRLPHGAVRLNSPVRSVEARGVTLESGERLEASAVVVATDAETAGELVPALEDDRPGWRSTVCLYYAAPRSPLNEAIIALNGESRGLVNNVCVPSDVSPDYAPQGKALVCVSLLGLHNADDLEACVSRELEVWFGEQVREWELLRTYRIRRALPEQPPARSGGASPAFQVHDGVHVCGDRHTSTSIEGALISGMRAAESVSRKLARSNSAARPAGRSDGSGR